MGKEIKTKEHVNLAVTALIENDHREMRNGDLADRDRRHELQRRFYRLRADGFHFAMWSRGQIIDVESKPLR